MIDVQQLTFAYNKAPAPALRALDFSIARGEVFGFLGPSGAGKSTTQKILIGLLRGYSGRVQVMGRDLSDWGADYYERIGVAFETPNHFLKLTALENLRYFGALYRGKTRDPRSLLEMVNLQDDGHLLVSQFSRGMKTRLTFVRALLNDPELLFLDEPTSGLDPVNARRIMDLIREQKEAGKTIFLTTHNMAVADELCDRVAFIVDGQIKMLDAPRDLKLRYGQRVVRVEFVANSHTQARDFALESLGDNPAFLQLLREQRVQTIHTQEATLEDIFIQVTGRSLS